MNRDPRGFYAALQVAPDATPAEIQRSFRALMRLRHPDREAAAAPAVAGAEPGAADRAADEVRLILESFAVLRNPASRAEYDPAVRSPAAGPAAAEGRSIPVRHHRDREPVLRVTPVRWERPE
ncbi:J domain-containing protein [Arthrobacter sp. UKPF54-2]|uniref:DnaJ domain-containing protein n=1 Tax=Arthrobacter sp. UKPF54-2 TaxID=2600159 RepID=UPI0011B1A6EB|nr:DnaJ domain-containing protein [Arthrobacter sp. UKPF54-2]QDY90118.1 J domain-containing protein [Arthrobacter sp. UKPF54-2]